jgi:hypothetical protein
MSPRNDCVNQKSGFTWLAVLLIYAPIFKESLYVA